MTNMDNKQKFKPGDVIAHKNDIHETDTVVFKEYIDKMWSCAIDDDEFYMNETGNSKGEIQILHSEYVLTKQTRRKKIIERVLSQ